MLAEHGVRPDKRLGQHFLVSEAAIRKIIDRLEGVRGVLEIGPGPGVLTRPATLRGLQVTAVELDAGILGVLGAMAPEAKVIHGDALLVDMASLLEALPIPRAILSNMPYNITGPLLEVVCQLRGKFVKAVLMMQREVGEKILARAGDSRRGALSVVIQAFFQVKRVTLVPPGAFLPPPKVESVVLELVPLETVERVEDVIAIVRAGFASPRKTLLNNLSRWEGRQEAQARLDASGLPPSLRPHQLTWEQWQTLLV